MMTIKFAMMKRLNTKVLRLALDRIRTQEGYESLRGVKVVSKHIKSKRILGHYNAQTETILMYPDNANSIDDYIDTLLHEFAHHVVDSVAKDQGKPFFQAHGSYWRNVAEYVGANPRATQLRGKYKLPQYIVDGLPKEDLGTP